jgi:hypothetical protein
MTAGLDGLETLARVRAFLCEQIVPSVPGELASEVRAAVKLLDTAAIELNQRHALLLAELADSIDYCQRAAQLVGRPDSTQTWLAACRTLAERAGEPGLDLRGLDGVLRDVRALGSTLLVELGKHQRASGAETAGELAAEFCACLGDHARRRLAWQAVFPVSPDSPPSTGVTYD